ncbi:MAG TPA: T9SS type A sorting domain-containing protein [Bacteroidia bacterium]|nr:T9SS type A sorting domain-containing protein [Bacteroidia bacterium]
MKTKLLILIFLLAAVRSVKAQTIINMPISGTQTVTTCHGIFYDSGGAGGNYSNNENGVLTICPDTAGQYVSVSITSFATEAAFDVLSVYNGTSITSPILAPSPLSGNLTCLSPLTSSDTSGCLTFRFITNGSNTQSGWIGNVGCTWSPTVTTPVGATCANPVVIPSVPFTDSAQCTQCMLNDYTNQSGICNTTYAGEDRVYVYTTTAPETDCITMSNTTGNPALAIYMNCPGAGGTCLTPTPMVGNNTMQFTFPSAGTYYIIIDEASGYSCYDLSITPCAIGIDETSMSSSENISIIQNPLTEQITFSWKNVAASTISVIDCLGRLMSTANTNEGVASFSTASWARGIYFVKVKGEKEERVAKFVKQ